MKRKNFKMKNLIRGFVLATAAALASSFAFAQGAIKSVTGSLQGGAEVLRIDFTQPLPALPTGFATQ